MPLITQSSYRPPLWLPGGHAQTIFPALFRKIGPVTCLGERLELDDGDFLDLEWSGRNRPKLAILSHGLEGHLHGGYIQGMAAALVKIGYDVLAWNFRGCGDEPNRLLSFYHSGATHDLAAVIDHAEKSHPARSIDLIGFSLGGNMTLKYLGECGTGLPEKIRRAVAFSVPCDLADSSDKLSSFANRLYMDRFLRSLRKKLQIKNQTHPGKLNLDGLEMIRSFQQFDDRFTAPLHGFKDANDYWTRSSCRQFIPAISIPTLLVNAANDPFLGTKCYPREEAENSDSFYFEIPKTGGHVGFPETGGYWSERRAVEYLST